LRWHEWPRGAISDNQPVWRSNTNAASGGAMSEATLWWIIAGVLVAAELATGTFYLLMLALGAAAGAIAAHLGVANTAQMVVAALVGGLAVAACYVARERYPKAPSASADRNVNLDIGETLNVEHWNADGTATVRYRGAPWTAVFRNGTPPGPGIYRVVEVVGSRLVVVPK
jgi:membrane protein implicated in regulation of membrane protease activity